MINVIRGDVAIIGRPVLRLIGVKTRPPPSPVRPGLISWQCMARVGHIDKGIREARARDERRTFKGHLALALHWQAFVISAAEWDFYEKSYFDCDAPSRSSESVYKPNSAG